MNTAFDANTTARASFMRAFDSWRCGTGINWSVGATTSINHAVSDGTNIITFDDAAPLGPGYLNHVISPGAVMHYALFNGATGRT